MKHRGALPKLYPMLPLRCTCGNTERWEDASDAATGSAYVQCLACRKYWLLSRNGWIDREGTGVLMDNRYTVGSAWSRSVSSIYYGRML